MVHLKAEQQIPIGNDRKKSKGTCKIKCNSKGKSNRRFFDFAALRSE